MNDTEQFIQDTKRQWNAAEKLELMASRARIPELVKHVNEACAERDEARKNYALAHSNLGNEVFENGKLQGQIKELLNQRNQLLTQLAEKNETANIFMLQVQKLQDENAALRMLCADNGITVQSITVA